MGYPIPFMVMISTPLALIIPTSICAYAHAQVNLYKRNCYRELEMASLLNFLLMQELVESLKRDEEEKEEKQREEAPPKNFFQVNDYKAWRGGQEACKREQMVIALEITDQFSDSSGRVRPLFLRLAKEFDSIPFLSVLTGPGRRLTTDKVYYSFIIARRLYE